MWEYDVIVGNDVVLINELNQKGKQEWELVTVLRGKLYDTAYLKRPRLI